MGAPEMNISPDAGRIPAGEREYRFYRLPSRCEAAATRAGEKMYNKMLYSALVK